MTTPAASTAAATTDPVAAAAAFIEQHAKSSAQPEPDAPSDALILSYSQLSTYQECEWRWYLTSALKTPRVPRLGGVVGTALHTAFANALTTYRDTEMMPTDDGVVGEAHYALYLEAARVDPDGAYFDDKQMGANEQRLIAIARAFAVYVRSLARRDPPLRPVFVEEKFNIAHPADASVRLRGVVDLVAERDGKFAGIDWKTGRWFSKDDVRESLQTESYLLGAARMAMSDEGRAHGWKQLSSFTYILFPYDELDKLAVAKAYASQRTPQQIQKYLTTLSRVATEMRLKRPTEAFKPHYSGACARCEVLHACERGQHWLTARKLKINPIMLVTPPVPERVERSDDHEEGSAAE